MKLLPKALHFWHHGAAWVFGPFIVGLTAAFMAIQSEYASNVNKWLFSAFPLAPLLIMPAGFALIAFFTARYFPGTAGSGIPQTIAALDEKGPKKRHNLLSPRIAIGKVMMTLAGLLVGASIGREGPTVQIGASIMHFFYGRGPFRHAEQRRIFILAGGAAGIAAAFNTPLAGIMFAVEELSKNHVFKANSSTLLTVVFSGLISLFLLGNYTYFGTSNAFLEWHSGIIAIILCGAVGGVAGGFFSRGLLAASIKLPAYLGENIKNRPLVFAAACGLVVAILGVMTDGMVFGTGYEVTRRTLEDNGNLPWYFGAAKFTATLLSAVSGIPGGIFAPSLAVGAGIGDNIAALLPALAPHSAVILLVMAAYLSGVTRAPITSFIIMMEMTNSHHMLLPLMAVTVVASGVSKLVSPTPLYHALSERFLPPPREASPVRVGELPEKMPH